MHTVGPGDPLPEVTVLSLSAKLVEPSGFLRCHLYFMSRAFFFPTSRKSVLVVPWLEGAGHRSRRKKNMPENMVLFLVIFKSLLLSLFCRTRLTP
jgi:hypothetical protein